MILWVDENVPFRLAKWINQSTDCRAYSFKELRLSSLDDKEIYFKAKSEAERLPAGETLVIVTKDSDFVDLQSIYSAPPSVVLIMVGNTSKNIIISSFMDAFLRIREQIEQGEHLVFLE